MIPVFKEALLSLPSGSANSINIQLSNNTRFVVSVNVNNDGSAQAGTYIRCGYALDFDVASSVTSDLVYTKEIVLRNNGEFNSPAFFPINLPFETKMGINPVIRVTGFQQTGVTRLHQVKALIFEENS